MISVGGCRDRALVLSQEHDRAGRGRRPYTPLESPASNITFARAVHLPFADDRPLPRGGAVRHYSLAAESMYDHPHHGARAQRPDLARVGGNIRTTGSAIICAIRARWCRLDHAGLCLPVEDAVNGAHVTEQMRTAAFVGVPYSDDRSTMRRSIWPPAASDDAGGPICRSVSQRVLGDRWPANLPSPRKTR